MWRCLLIHTKVDVEHYFPAVENVLFSLSCFPFSDYVSGDFPNEETEVVTAGCLRLL